VGKLIFVWTRYCADYAVERVNTELKKQILQARTGAKMTQAQLAKVFFCFRSMLYFSGL